ncbi:salicylate hydroxylase [Pandoraea iniqua]|uniref:aromatic-ring-hydroxylating dioxygenase subunit beta n=1 Tax=Pandoraea iniqua TaxID=2508288 RepID=UPI00123FF3E6|nr:aromatic-ring-hydroxylating dioxygenase subunit beta [Pandoraea iniqua]VVE39793.1 salicylate hydroxylase [Pandoraea iniqua]
MVDFVTFQAVVELNAAYAAALDAQQWDAWPGFFLDDCIYRVQPRENHEMGLPLATLSFESRGMLQDRIYGIRDTLFHDPYYQRHVIGLPSIKVLDETTLHVESNYAVFRTKPDQLTDILSVGRYLDIVKRTGDGWKFASRLCIFDSEMIPNSLIYPI